MRPNRRTIRRAIEELADNRQTVNVETEVHTIHDSGGLDREIPEGATVLPTESDVVTVYKTD